MKCTGKDDVYAIEKALYESAGMIKDFKGNNMLSVEVTSYQRTWRHNLYTYFKDKDGKWEVREAPMPTPEVR